MGQTRPLLRIVPVPNWLTGSMRCRIVCETVSPKSFNIPIIIPAFWFSISMSPAQRKRLRRLQLRASQPIQDALAAGVISIRRADILLHLPENEQKSQLDRILRSKQTEILR